MINLRILTDANGMLEGIPKENIIDASNAQVAFGRLQHGMQSGEDSVSITIELEDGRVVFTQTSMKLFMAAARVFENIRNN